MSDSKQYSSAHVGWWEASPFVLGWAAAGLASSGWQIGRLVEPGSGAEWLSRFVDLGRHVGVGLLIGCVVALVRHHVESAARRWGVSAGAVLLGGALTLPADLSGLAGRLGESWGVATGVVLAGIVIAVAAGFLSAVWLSAPARARWLRLSVVCLGAPVAFWLNVTLSPGSNSSAHWFLSALVATWLAHAVAMLPWRARRERRATWLTARVLVGALVIGSLWAWCAPHANSTMVALARRPSSLQWLPLLQASAAQGEFTLRRVDNPFFQQRAALPPIAPAPDVPRLEQPIVVLITIDSLRADVANGKKARRYLPNFNELASAGARFVNARAPGTMTKYTLGAISSGVYFSQQKWSERKGTHWPDEDAHVHLAEHLGKAGAATAAFPATRWLSESNSLIRGFDRNRFEGERFSGRFKHWVTGRALTDQLIEQLAQLEGRSGFLWVHYLDSHDPFEAGGREGSKFKRYLRSLRVVDGFVGEIRDAVERLNYRDRTWFILASDHGEAFGEHSSYFHGDTLYDELLRVPLVFYGPGIVAQRIEQPVTLMDVGPTVLDWFGVATPARFMGESLLPLLRGKSRRFDRPIVAETRLKRATVFEDGYKVIRDLRRGTTEIYDLNRDPQELENLSDQLELDDEPHLAQMRAFFAVHTFTDGGYRLPYVK